MKLVILRKFLEPQITTKKFPVGSILIPKRFRVIVLRVYNFARLADDIADEGVIESKERIRLLNLFTDVLINPELYKKKGETQTNKEKKLLKLFYQQ